MAIVQCMFNLFGKIEKPGDWSLVARPDIPIRLLNVFTNILNPNLFTVNSMIIANEDGLELICLSSSVDAAHLKGRVRGLPILDPTKEVKIFGRTGTDFSFPTDLVVSFNCSTDW